MPYDMTPKIDPEDLNPEICDQNTRNTIPDLKELILADIYLFSILNYHQ